MKKLILLFLLIPLVSFGQVCYLGFSSGSIEDKCEIDSPNLFKKETDRADPIIDKILSQVGASKRFIITKECKGINNAVAYLKNDYRYILYDPDFIKNIEDDSKSWGNIIVLSHEIGHHIKFHTMPSVFGSLSELYVESNEQLKSLEIEADEFAGFILQKLGASREEVIDAMENLLVGSSNESLRYPAKQLRIDAVKNGWENSKANISDRELSMGIEDYNIRGIKQFEQENYEGAIEDFSTAIQLDPTYYQSYLNRADSWSALGNFNQALQDLSMSIRIKPTWVGFNKRGNAKSNLKDYQGALEDFDSSIDLNPKYNYNYYRKGLLKIKLEQTDTPDINFSKKRLFTKDPLEDILNAIKNTNENDENYKKDLNVFYYGIADVYSKQDDALMSFDQDTRNYGNYFPGYSYEEAIKFASKAIEFDKNDWKSYKLRAKHQGKYGMELKGAVSDISRAIEIGIKDSLIRSEAYAMRGSFYINPQNLSEVYDKNKALEDYSMAIDLNSKNDKYYNERAKIYENEINDYEKSLDDYSMAIKIDSKNSDYYNSRAYLYYTHFNDYLKSIADYFTILSLTSNEDVGSYSWSMTYIDIGKIYRDDLGFDYYDKALKSFNTALEVGENYYKDIEYLEMPSYLRESIHFERAELYKKMERYNEALEDYNISINLLKKDIEEGENYGDKDYDFYKLSNYHFLKAQLFDFNLNNTDKALEYYNQAIKVINKVPELDLNDFKGFAKFQYIGARANLYALKIYNHKKAIEEYSSLINELEETNVELEGEQINYDVILAPAYGMRGYLNSMILKNYDKALNDFDKSIYINPKDPNIFIARGFLYANHFKNYNKALEDYSRAIDLDNKNARNYIIRGELLRDYIKDYDKALIDYNMAVELEPNSDNYNSRGLLHTLLNNPDEAIFDLTQSVRLNPSKKMVNNNLGTIYESSIKNYEKAIDFYTKEIELNPNKTTYLNRGNLYLGRLDEPEKALKDFLKVTELDPESFSTYGDIGDVYKDLGQFNKAIESYSVAIELNKSIFLESKEKDSNEYETVYFDEKGNALEKIKKPELDSYNYFLRSMTYRLLKNKTNALNDINAAIKIAKDDMDLFLYYDFRGILRKEKSQYNKALKDFNFSINFLENEISKGLNNNSYMNFVNRRPFLNPRTSYNYRAALYLEMGEYEKAISDCETTIDMDPKDPESYYLLALINKSQSNYQESIQNISTAIQLFSKEYFPDYDVLTGHLSLADLYIFRATLYKEIKSSRLNCKDLNTALLLLDSDLIKKLELELLISENCKG